MSSFTVHVASTVAKHDHAYTHFSLPFSRGKLQEVPVIRFAGVHKRFPAQVWPLAFWPDGSIRMLHGISPLSGGCYQVEMSSCPEDVIEGIVLREVGHDLCVFNKDDVIRFSPEHLSVDQFGMDIGVEWADGSVGQTELEGGMEVKRSGPLYVLLERWVKVKTDTKYLRFRLQFEFFHGIPGTAISVMLIHDCPGFIFQEIKAIQLWLKRQGCSPVVFQQNHGFEYLDSRFVETKGAVDIRVNEASFLPYVHNHEVLNDATSYPHYLRPPANRISSAAFLRSEKDLLQMEMEDFHLLRPKGLLLDQGSAAFAIWPAWTGPLTLQQGKRRQVRLAVYWGHEELPEGQAGISSTTAALFDVRRAQLAAEVYKQAGFFDLPRVLPYRPDKYPRFEGWLQAVSGIKTVAGFFDLGDTPDSHYRSTYIPVGYSKRTSPGPDPLFYTSSGRTASCREQLQDYEPIWVNNEYDVIFSLGTEYLRSGNRLLYRQMQWFARHTVEVDFLAYSEYEIHHRAQPAHSESHTSTGAYPSHFWTQGLAQYYFLSGDEDVREVIESLADKTIWYFEHPKLGGLHGGVNREMGWAVLTLVSAYEATGNEKYDLYARKMINAVVAEKLPNDLPCLSFGHTSLLLGCRAYLEVHQHSDDCQAVWNWCRELLDLAISSSQTPPLKAEDITLNLSYDYEISERGDLSRMQPRSGLLTGFAALDCLAYAYERTGEEGYLEAGLRTLQVFLDGTPGYFEFSFRNPLPEGKPFAMSYRSWITYLGALDRAHLLADFDFPSV